MEIVLGEGLGSIKFGMTPKDVIGIMGDKQVHESWMGGNLNGSLLYPGIIIGFDSCDSKGPLKNSKVYEFEIEESFADVQFMGESIFRKKQHEIEDILIKQDIPHRSDEDTISINSLGLELCLNKENRINHIYFWHSKSAASEEIKFFDKSQALSLDELLDFLRTTQIGWPQYFQRLKVIQQLGSIGDTRAINVLEEVVREDTQEFDAWGLGAGFSMAEFAQEAIDKIRAINQMNPNVDVVAFFVQFFKDVPYHAGAVKAEFSRYENPTWEADWIRAKQIIRGRSLPNGEAWELVVNIGGQNLQDRSEEAAYQWLEEMIVAIERHDK